MRVGRARDLRRRAGLAAPSRCIAAHRRDGRRRRWREIGVLTRDNAHAADVFDALTARRDPGRDRRPPGAAPAARGRRGGRHADAAPRPDRQRRAAHPARPARAGRSARATWRCSAAGPASWPARRPAGASSSATVAGSSQAAVEGADPTEVASLSDALDDPGDADYSAGGAASGSRCWPRSCATCARHAGEPLLDLVRRIIDTTGIDVELASSVSPAAAARRDNLDLFVKAVAEFQAVDGAGHAAGAAGLPRGRGRVRQRPRRGHPDRGRLGQAADRAPRQGPGVGRGVPGRASPSGKFPTTQPRTKWTDRSRPCCPTPLRGDARDLPAAAPAAHGRRPRAARATTARRTRARGAAARATSRSPGPGTCCRSRPTAGARTRKTPLGPSPYQRHAARRAGRLGRGARAVAGQAGEGHAQPARRRCSPTLPWPVEAHAGEVERRLRAAELVREALARRAPATATRRRRARHGRGRPVQEWDDELERLLDEARRDRRRRGRRCRCPSSLSATALARLRDDPDAVRRATWPGRCRASRRRRPGSAPGSTPGSRHGSASRQLLDPDELPGRGDAEIDDDDDLRELIERVRAGRRSPTGPRSRSSRRSRWCSAARWCAAASTRSTPSGDGGRLPASSTGRPTGRRPPTRSSSRSTGWPGPSCTGVPLERVRAAFYYVRTGDLVEPDGLRVARRARGLLARRPVPDHAGWPVGPWARRGRPEVTDGCRRNHDDHAPTDDRPLPAKPDRARSRPALVPDRVPRRWCDHVHTARQARATGTSRGLPLGTAPATSAAGSAQAG